MDFVELEARAVRQWEAIEERRARLGDTDIFRDGSRTE